MNPLSVEPRIFLLSPANANGPRARMLLDPDAKFDLARKLQLGGASVGEAFSFISGLYFRGKKTYAECFARPPVGAPGAMVITADRGLLPVDAAVSVADLIAMAGAPIDERNPAFREPLERDARRIVQYGCPVILLGSIATGKYIQPLVDIFGNKLLIPVDFPGRGDMSRGGLMLRAARERKELVYAPAEVTPRRGPRPSKLPAAHCQ